MSNYGCNHYLLFLIHNLRVMEMSLKKKRTKISQNSSSIVSVGQDRPVWRSPGMLNKKNLSFHRQMDSTPVTASTLHASGNSRASLRHHPWGFCVFAWPSITKSTCKPSSDLMTSHSGCPLSASSTRNTAPRERGTRWPLQILVVDLETHTGWKGSLEVSGPISTEDRTDFKMLMDLSSEIVLSRKTFPCLD